MQLRHRVALDGVWLDSVDSRIMINKIEEPDGKENVNTVSLWGESGSRVTEKHRDSLDVTVKFQIRLKKREMAAREEVLEKVNTWAYAGGWLSTNYKNDRRIRVFLAQAAGAGDPWEWTKEYSLVFRACGVPYWQMANPSSVMRSGTNYEHLNMSVSGSTKSVLEAQFVNTSGSTIDTVSIDAGESAMSFSGLGLGNGETLVIDHDDNGLRAFLRIRILSTGGVWRSAMGKRNPASSNELTVSPGQHTVVFSAGGTGKITVSNYGRFA